MSERIKKLANEAIELITEFYGLMEENEVCISLKEIKLAEDGRTIEYKTDYDEIELDITNIADKVEEEIYGYGPCPSGLEEHIESLLDVKNNLNIDRNFSKEEREKAKAEFIEKVGSIYYFEKRVEDICKELKKIEKEAKGKF